MTELNFQKKLLTLFEENVNDKQKGFDLIMKFVGMRVQLLEMRKKLVELANEANRMTQHND